MRWRKSVVTLVPRCECGFEFELGFDWEGKISVLSTPYKCPVCEEKVRPLLAPIFSQGKGVVAIIKNVRIRNEDTPEFLKKAKFISLIPKCSCGYVFATRSTESEEIAFVPGTCPACKREVKKIIVPKTRSMIKAIEIRR